MLKSHSYSVIFPTNGVRLKGDFTFQPGCTAVTGRNGKGKTFGTQEIWRYLLFGKKALRGPASDYKTLEAKGVVTIKDHDYVISRTPKGESVVWHEGVLAVGADAVNKKLIELLGYGLEVFDVANCAVQKESNKLTQLTPGKRKELIDEVVGLAHNERVEKECKDKAKQAKMQVEAIIDNLIVPTAPIQPDGYRDSKQIEIELGQARKIEAMRTQLLDITNETIEKPIAPSKPRIDFKELREHELKRSAVEAEKRTLREQIAKIPVASFTAEQVAQAELVVSYTNEVARRGPKPELAEDASLLGLEAWQHIELLKGVDTEVTCPKCSNTFRTDSAIPPEPNQPKAYFEDQLRRHSRWHTQLDNPGTCELALLNLDTRNAAHTALVRSADRVELETQLMTMPTYDDRSNELVEVVSVNEQWETYDRLSAEFEQKRQDVVDAFAKLKTLPEPIKLAELDHLYVGARVYEQRLEDFKIASEGYDFQMAKAKTFSEEADGFRKGAGALAEARKEMKAYLAPSLSRVASSLISEMTEGRFSNVIVDEDMNISVDGQDVATLSGAQSTAANLAMRLALARVLVASVLPVFIGDEISADLDYGYNQATVDCLKGLKDQFSQIIVITHDDTSGFDHVIDLNEA